jgi:hypothetical protein
MLALNGSPLGGGDNIRYAQGAAQPVLCDASDKYHRGPNCKTRKRNHPF